MNCIITIVRYPGYSGFGGFLSMALFRLPLVFNKRISFWKLLGCGKNGTFDIHPDWRQWGILTVTAEQSIGYDNQSISYQLLYGSFISWWWKFCRCETYTIILKPIEGYGTWDHKAIFGTLPRQTDYEGVIAVLTRATIRLKRLKNFWQNVGQVSSRMKAAPGLITSVGIGEVPWIKQATFSVWQSKELMKQFAYKMQEHQKVIYKTRKENWYKEEMFVRFKIVTSFGTLDGNNPLAGKL